jgi:hypothetical protein
MVMPPFYLPQGAINQPALLEPADCSIEPFYPLHKVSLYGPWCSRQQPGDGGRMDLEEPRGIGGRFVAFGNHLSDLRLESLHIRGRAHRHML